MRQSERAVTDGVTSKHTPESSEGRASCVNNLGDVSSGWRRGESEEQML